MAIISYKQATADEYLTMLDREYYVVCVDFNESARKADVVWREYLALVKKALEQGQQPPKDALWVKYLALVEKVLELGVAGNIVPPPDLVARSFIEDDDRVDRYSADYRDKDWQAFIRRKEVLVYNGRWALTFELFKRSEGRLPLCAELVGDARSHSACFYD
jgi:hypothetical protein